jgi:hypothetical protein
VVRGVYAKKKRRTDNYGNLFIARDWALFYLKQRQIARFTQSLNLLPYEALSPDKEVFFKRLPYVESVKGISIYTCSTNFVKALLLKTGNIPYFFFNPTHSVVSHTQSTNLEDSFNSRDLGSHSLKFDGLLYPIDSNHFLTSKFANEILLKFTNLMFKVSLYISIEFRKLATHLIILSVQ